MGEIMINNQEILYIGLPSACASDYYHGTMLHAKTSYRCMPTKYTTTMTLRPVSIESFISQFPIYETLT